MVKGDINMTTTQANRLDTFVLGPAGTRSKKPLKVLGSTILVKASGEDTGDQFSVVHTTVMPMSGPPLHRHSLEDEFFYVLEGEITWQIDGRRISGGPGTSAFAPRGTAHTFQNFGTEPARMLGVITPSGMERFFEDTAAANEGLVRPDLVKSEQIMNAYGIELLGPPLT